MYKRQLLDNEIPASKEAGAEGLWKVQVEESQFARAVQILKVRALPRSAYASMGTVFKKEGLLSTPLEEKARFVFAVSQELSATLASMDGVLDARVHIVPLETNELGERVSPATVSVFIKHAQVASAEISGRVDDIRKLVSKSVQGIDPENIHISLFSADESIPLPKGSTLYETVFGIPVMRGHGIQIWMLVGLIALTTCLCAGLVDWFRLRKPQEP